MSSLFPSPSHSSPGFGGFDDGSPAAVAARTAALLQEAQQEILFKHRFILAQSIAQKDDPTKIVDRYQNSIVGRPHFGTWDSFFPMIDGMWKFGPPPDPLIILGGWLRTPPAGLSGVLPPPIGVQQAARLRGIYCEARRLHGLAIPHPGRFNQAEWDEFKRWIDDHYNDFLGARRDDGNIYYGDIMEFTSKNITPLLDPLLDGLMFMTNQAMAFYSTPSDPGAAWRDLWEFCTGYNTIYEGTRNKYGPYYLLIVSPAALAALRAAAAAATAAAAAMPAAPTPPAPASPSPTPSPVPPNAS